MPAEASSTTLFSGSTAKRRAASSGSAASAEAGASGCGFLRDQHRGGRGRHDRVIDRNDCAGRRHGSVRCRVGRRVEEGGLAGRGPGAAATRRQRSPSGRRRHSRSACRSTARRDHGERTTLDAATAATIRCCPSATAGADLAGVAAERDEGVLLLECEVARRATAATHGRDGVRAAVTRTRRRPASCSARAGFGARPSL